MSDPTGIVVPGDSSCDVSGCIVRAEGLTKRYRLGKDNYVDALRGASVHIRPGEMVAIMGPSGSGKSTMMHMIGCLDAPDEGEVWINGRRVDSLRGKALTRLRSREIGFIFQGFNLIPTLSALENVALAAEYAGANRLASNSRARELLDLVGIGDRARHIPSELSGGQQQRVAIARSLINSPSVVLGDEPTGDLDTRTSDEIVDMMREVNLETGTTFILVTHNPEVAEGCDRTILMRDGIVFDADWDESEREADAALRAEEARRRKERIRRTRDAAKARAAADGGGAADPPEPAEPTP
jgi:putative ABC transport system ATP-binding protein